VISVFGIVDIVSNDSKIRMRTAWQSQPRSPLVGGGNAYIPHPAPDSAGNEDEERASRMGATLSLLKVCIPSDDF